MRPSLLHHYLVLALLLVLLAFGEKLLFALYHAPLHEGMGVGELLATLLWGGRFDLAVAGLYTLLAWFAAWPLVRLLRWDLTRALSLTGGLAVVSLLALQGGDLLYFSEAGRHLGYELRDTLGSGVELALMAITGSALMVGLQLLLMGAALALLLWLLRRARHEQPPGWWFELSLPLVLIISALLLRGGLQSVPLEPLHAQQIGDSRKATLTLNGAYNALFSSLTPYSVEPLLNDAPSAGELARIATLYPPVPPSTPPAGEAANVIIVFLESWTAAYMSSYGYPLATTPEFDALRGQGLTTIGMLAGGHRTTEGMFSTLCSAQNPLGNTVAQTQLQNYPYRCLPHLLRERGYSSAFFQGTLTNTSGTGAFANLLGFERNFGRDDISELTLPLNNWGVHDSDIYHFARQQMKAMPKPFLVGINTNSTHDHRLPEGVEPAFPDAKDPTINTLHLADGALGEFVRALRGDPELRESLIVLVADHVGAAPASSYQHYSIPFVLLGSDTPPRKVERIASQRDIAPTLLELLGLPAADWFSGKSLLHDDLGPYYADYYHSGLLGWVEGEQLVTFPVRDPNRLSCYQPLIDPGLRSPIECDPQAQEIARNGLLLSSTWQRLLFAGRQQGFAELVSVGKEE